MNCKKQVPTKSLDKGLHWPHTLRTSLYFKSGANFVRELYLLTPITLFSLVASKNSCKLQLVKQIALSTNRLKYSILFKQVTAEK